MRKINNYSYFARVSDRCQALSETEFRRIKRHRSVFPDKAGNADITALSDRSECLLAVAQL